MVSEVIHQSDALGLGADLKAPTYPLKLRQDGSQLVQGQPKGVGSGDSHGGVVHVVLSGEAEVKLLAMQGEVAAVRPAGLDLVTGGSLRTAAHLKNFTGGVLGHLDGLRVIGIDQSEAVFGDDVQQLAERFLDGSQVGVDVGMIELDVVEDDQFGKVVEELAAFVSKGSVVLVSLQHPEIAPAVVTAPGEINRNPADEPAGLEAALFQQEGQHGGGGGLAMGAGDNKVPAAIEEPAAEEFRQGDKGNPVGEDGLKLRVPAGDNVAYHGEVGLRGKVFLAVALVEDDAAFAEEVGHRRIDGLIGAGDLEAKFPEHGGDRAHAGAGDPEEVEVLKLGAVEHGRLFGWRRRAGESSRKPKTGASNQPPGPTFRGRQPSPPWGRRGESWRSRAPAPGWWGRQGIPRWQRSR